MKLTIDTDKPLDSTEVQAIGYALKSKIKLHCMDRYGHPHETNKEKKKAKENSFKMDFFRWCLIMGCYDEEYIDELNKWGESK